jgi:hypothetical protein
LSYRPDTPTYALGYWSSVDAAIYHVLEKGRAEMSAVSEAREARANSNPFGRSLVAAGVVVLLILGGLVVALGPPDSAEGFGSVVGSLSFPALMAGLIIGWAARRSNKPWRWWKYFATVTPLVLLLMALAALGRLGGQ